MAPWNRQIEVMPTDELRQLQYRLAKSLIRRLYETSEFYRRRMRELESKHVELRVLAPKYQDSSLNWQQQLRTRCLIGLRLIT